MDDVVLSDDSQSVGNTDDASRGGNGDVNILNVQDILGKISNLVKQRKHNEALVECNKGLEVKPHHDKLLEKKIKVLCQLCQFPEAHELASSWTKRQPEHPIAIKELNKLEVILEAINGQDSDDEEEMAGEEERAGEEEGAGDTKQDENHNLDHINTTLNNTQINGKEPGLEASQIQLSNYDDLDGFECTFCDIKFSKKEELETHCRSDLHKKRLTSDESQDWKFRPPPRGLSSEEYSLCQRFSENGRCTFGEKCTEAHSEDELKEWKERFKFRREQLQKAREKLLHGNSFTEKLMERLMVSENPRAILVQSIDLVKLHINSDLKVNMVNKRCTNAWTITVTSKMCLHNVCLLDDVNKSYFYISSISVGPKKTQKYQNLENHCQEWSNQDVSMKSHGEYVYRVKVVFKTDIFGTFRQSIIFDFGLETVLMREMQVESTSLLDTNKLTSDLIITESNRWTDDKVSIIPYEPKYHHHSEGDKNLLAKYILPRVEKFQRPDSTIMQSLSKDNYRLWMHEMLYLEEMTQLSVISAFNVKTSLLLVNSFLLMPGALSTAKYAHSGELFAKMELADELSVDSLSGRLILQNAQFALIAPAKPNDKKSPPKKAYEVIIEDKGKNFIYLRLSKTCVEELKFSSDEAVSVLVQFQLNRLPKVEMHDAVDKLPTLDIVFPVLDKYENIPWSPDRQWNNEIECKLNVKQKEAVLSITADPDLQLPPLLIVGPFGTGKTYTLAQAAKQVLKHQDGSRILICTHSNSAADLYIREFFHSWVEEGLVDFTPLRILYKHRWIQTVSDTTLKYTLYDSSSCTFKFPTIEDLEKHRVIITTLSTARYISDLNLSKGFFSHVFIDEAAQALESETTIPLSMVCSSTRLVLAGDHMQLSPEVYSEFCRQQGFQMSLLERLHEYYPHDHPCKIMLCENYRSHSAIVDFTSELFYENKLISSGKQKAHSKHYPLTFYAAKGEEIQHQNSTGFYNIAEVYEVVERVEDLQRQWSEEWGPMDDNAISVVTPYTDQVKYIRNELRRKKLYHISVERVHNIQGKQYRAIILSTVRTQSTCRSDSSEEEYLDYGFLSNVKLLNTAITRAQSLVMVVGDPVSLCLVGKCRKVWEYFLELCNQHSSLHGMTWTQLRSQLAGVEMTKTYTLNPLAPEFIPNRLYHITKAASETIGMNLHTQPSVPYWQPYGPYSMSGYHPHYPMFPSMMPYAFPGYMPNMYTGNRVMYKPISTAGRSSPQRTRSASPNTARSASPKPSASQISPNGQKPTHKDAIKIVDGKLNAKHSRGRMMMYMPQRFPMAYPPYMNMIQPHHSGYYCLPEDPRLQVLPFMPLPPTFPQYPGVDRMYTGMPTFVHHSSSSMASPPRSDSDSEKTDNRSSPIVTSSGQQIQLLPNVKHAPGHLTGSSKVKKSSPNPAGTNTNPNQSPPVLKQSAEEKRVHVSDRPYSPANYTCERSTTPGSDSEQPVKPRPFSKNQGPFSQRGIHNTSPDSPTASIQQGTLTNRRSGKSLQLVTGFSRQFSDDLPTPSEVKDIVQMIEESVDEEVETTENKVKEQSRTHGASAISTPPLPPLPPKLSLHVTPPASEEKSVGASSKLSYAGVLRKQPTTVNLSPESIRDRNDAYSNIEPQTPRTPQGFITPGADMDMDPFGILKGLNIESTPHRSFQQY